MTGDYELRLDAERIIVALAHYVTRRVDRLGDEVASGRDPSEAVAWHITCALQEGITFAMFEQWRQRRERGLPVTPVARFVTLEAEVWDS